MQIRFVLLFSLFLGLIEGRAQQTPVEIKYKAWNIHALRYFKFTQPADSFMYYVINRNQNLFHENRNNYYEKISADLILNKQFLADKNKPATTGQFFVYKHFLFPYNSWLKFSRPFREDSLYLNLSLFLSERKVKEDIITQLSVKSPFELIGSNNLLFCFEEWMGEIDIFRERSEVFFSNIKSPLSKNALMTYQFFFSSQTEMGGIPVYEIAFFSHKKHEKAFEGYLYISVHELYPVKAIFTLNPHINKKPAKVVLFIQTPIEKKTLLFTGDEITNSILVEKVRIRSNESLDSTTTEFLTPAQKEISGLVEESRKTRAFSNLQNGLSFLMTDHVGILRGKFNLGPITQMLSYNYMEGIRIRTGGYTSQQISKHASIGGYIAYGTRDNLFKYCGDLVVSPRLTEQFRFVYTSDLNIPGHDYLEDKRDRIFYSLYHAHTTNLSLRKTGQLSYEIGDIRYFSFKLHAKYLYDKPLGIVKYETFNDGIYTRVNHITTSEVGVTFQYSPKKKYIIIKNKKIVFNPPDVDFRMNHRIGIKGVFGSKTDYHITDASLFKSFGFPMNTGSLNLKFSGGKVWSSVPFPLLFIPAGNQSYIYEANNYNLMQFYEFVTDRFVTCNADIKFNLSPIKFIYKKSKMKIHGGVKALYGPLSEKNNPQFHSELFVFNNGIKTLGKTPYAEANIGLSGIFNYIRIDYIYRLTHGKRGSLFLSTNYSF